MDNKAIEYAASRLHQFNEGAEYPWKSLTIEEKKESLGMVKMIVGWYLAALLDK